MGDETDITWTWRGLSISDNLVLESSNDNFVLTKQTIATGIANTGTHHWVITGDSLTGSTLKMRITDASRTAVIDMGDGYFRIRGGFTLISPNGGQNWGALSTQTISWTTLGNIPNVKLQYSTDSGVTWINIIASVTNTSTYSWVVPDLQSSTVKVRVVDPNDDTVYDDSDADFTILYFTVKFNIMDYDTLQHLNDFSIAEPTSTGWNATGQSSPITRTLTYSSGTYTTYCSKTNYIDNSATWNAPTTGTAQYVVTIYLENSASAQVTWNSILTYSFSPGSDTLNAVGSLQRKGKLVGTSALERADMGAATLEVYEPDGTTVRNSLSAVTPNSTTGMYTFTLVDTGFEEGKVYPATLAIAYRGRDYISTANIDVGSEILQYRFFTETAANLAASVDIIEAAVAGGTQQTRSDIQAARLETKTDLEATRTQLVSDIAESGEEMQTHVSEVLSTTEAALKISVAAAQLETAIARRSEILNAEGAIKLGNTITIRYRTFSGTTPKLDLYDGSNIQRVVKATMTEIGTTGIYEYSLTFTNSWGKGDYTIVCSESVYGSLDALTISALSSDIEDVYGQVSAVLGSTAGLSGLGDVADEMSSQFGVIETALSKVGKDLLKEVKDAAGSGDALDSVFEQMAKVAKQVKKMAGSETVDLEKLYKVSTDKKQDITYLKNKSQELKAAMELNAKMVDNIANKPVTQTWYEYR